MNMLAFCDLRDGGPPELKPLINSIQDFYSESNQKSQQDSAVRRVHVFESTRIRRELFKLKYESGEFQLNFEADAFECFDFLITCIHTWSQHASQPPANKLSSQVSRSAGDYNLPLAAQISCDKRNAEPCFVHNMFHIKEYQLR